MLQTHSVRAEDVHWHDLTVGVNVKFGDIARELHVSEQVDTETAWSTREECNIKIDTASKLEKRIPVC